MGDARSLRAAAPRIPGQRERLLAVLTAHAGRWWTKERLADVVGGTAHSMSARLSELDRAGVRIEKHRLDDGTLLYRVPRGGVGSA